MVVRSRPVQKSLWNSEYGKKCDDAGLSYVSEKVRKMFDFKLLEIICCPSCKFDLTFKDDLLFCAKCGRKYETVDGIPILLTDEVEHAHFKKQRDYFDEEFQDYVKYSLAEWQKRYVIRIGNLFGFHNSDLLGNELFIDIGVGGSGYTVIEFAKLGIPSVGCDLSLEGVVRAKAFSKSQNIHSLTSWVVCSAEELPFKDGRFRYLSCNAVLEHLLDDKRAVEEFSRITKTNSKIYVTAPIKMRYVWLFLIPLNYFHDKRIGHRRRYDRRSLDELFRPIGFQIEDIYYTGHLFKTLGVISSHVLKSNRFDELLERLDERQYSSRFGASNIGASLVRRNPEKDVGQVV